MAETYGNLGQQKPLGGVLTDLTTVPAGQSYVTSTIFICNQSSSVERYRISHAIAGAADTAAQYIAYDTPLLPNETRAWTVGVTMAPTDKLRCQSLMGNASFNVVGAIVA
jgi:hypothetical protein